MTGRHERYGGVTHTILMRDRLSLNSRTIADSPNNDYNNPVLYYNGRVIETKGYCTDLFFGRAIRRIGEQKRAGKPFFAYITPNVNHGPHIPPILPDGSLGDIMENLDDNVGKMMKFLDQSGLSEETLLIYMTDNGAGSGDKRLRGGKGTAYEGGSLRRGVASTRVGSEPGVSREQT